MVYSFSSQPICVKFISRSKQLKLSLWAFDINSIISLMHWCICFFSVSFIFSFWFCLFLLCSPSFLPFMFFQAKCMRWCLLLPFCIFCLSRLFHLSRLFYRLCVSCTFRLFFFVFSWTIAVLFALWSWGSFPGLALRKARTIPTSKECIFWKTKKV